MRTRGLLRLGFLVVVLSSVALPRRASAATEYYVAPTGSDSNPGTMAAPFATLQKGHDVAVAGDTVWIRGGTYAPTTGKSNMSGYTISKSGTSDANRIKFWAYPGELPVFDFSQLQIGTGTSAGIYVTGSWLHFKGFEVKNVPMPGGSSNNGIWNVGSSANPASNNIFENLNIHHITGPGLSIAHNSGSGGGHLILNVDSHDNYDPNSSQGDGQNADGFGHHYQKTGPTSIYRGCRAWWNSDDGFDLINQEVPVIIENCWAMQNGYSNSGTTRPSSGNGNGFKAGSSQTGIRHVIRNSLAWKNGAAGFYANHSSGGNDWYNNTSYMNLSTQYNMLASPAGDPNTTIVLTGSLVHHMRNNIGFPNKNSNMNGVDTMFNSWDLNITPANGDFVSVSDTNVIMGPRKADGSLPDVSFMHLSANSQMINKGTDVGLPFVGSAPDLGAFEYGAATTGSGGTGGSSGGTAGTSGAAGTAGGGRGGAGGGAAGRGGTSGGAAGRGGMGGAASGSAGATGSAGNGAAGSNGVGTGGNAGTSAGAGGTSASGGSTMVTGAGGDGGATATGTGGVAAGTGGNTGSAGSIGSGGSGVTTGGASGGGSIGSGGSGVTTGSGGTTPGETGASGGCACDIGATSTSASLLSLLAGLCLVVGRRRRARR